MSTPRARLSQVALKGGVTLVLGAGISLPHAIPSWGVLVENLWKRVMKKSPPELLSHPMSNQFALELIEHTVAKRSTSIEKEFTKRLLKRQQQGNEDEGVAQQQEPLGGLHRDDEEDRGATKGGGSETSLFGKLLRETLYEGFRGKYPNGEFWQSPNGNAQDPSSQESLATLAELLKADYSGARNITRVISFNVDDLLERSVFGPGKIDFSHPTVWPIARESHHPKLTSPRPIPIYHIHGFLPEHENYLSRHGEETLVFTDLQYWNSVANANSFANRVFLNALHDSHCVFIGVSMSDINLIRWLGIRASEVFKDKLQAFPGKRLYDVKVLSEKSLSRHFWIHCEEEEKKSRRKGRSNKEEGEEEEEKKKEEREEIPTNLLKEFLLRRGVETVPIKDWGQDFRLLMRECFPPKK